MRFGSPTEALQVASVSVQTYSLMATKRGIARGSFLRWGKNAATP